jgi:hypothetical protein
VIIRNKVVDTLKADCKSFENLGSKKKIKSIRKLFCWDF